MLCSLSSEPPRAGARKKSADLWSVEREGPMRMEGMRPRFCWRSNVRRCSCTLSSCRSLLARSWSKLCSGEAQVRFLSKTAVFTFYELRASVARNRRRCTRIAFRSRRGDSRRSVSPQAPVPPPRLPSVSLNDCIDPSVELNVFVSSAGSVVYDKQSSDAGLSGCWCRSERSARLSCCELSRRGRWSNPWKRGVLKVLARGEAGLAVSPASLENTLLSIFITLLYKFIAFWRASNSRQASSGAPSKSSTAARCSTERSRNSARSSHTCPASEISSRNALSAAPPPRYPKSHEYLPRSTSPH